MIPSVIEREILIEAPPEVVWGIVTEPGQVSQWFSDAADIDLRPGGEGTLTFGDRATTERVTVRLLVEAVEPPHRFVFRWDYPPGAQPREGNSLRVEFTLVGEGEKTRLRVAESGFAQLDRPEEERTASAEAHGQGWDAHLASLAGYVAGRS
jgi:uncharacterized protein YndB with AHSA1/START domain